MLELELELELAGLCGFQIYSNPDTETPPCVCSFLFPQNSNSVTVMPSQAVLRGSARRPPPAVAG